MSDSIGFMFHTRTLSEDYRVFAGSGGEALKDERAFKRITEIAALEYDEEESAVIFEDGGKVYVAAFGLMRGGRDRAGRDKRFSFCLILPADKKAAAMRAFSRVSSEWHAAADTVNGLIEEVPVTREDWKGRDKRGENVRFDSRKFIGWLTSSAVKVAPPKAGTMLKYFAETGKTITVPKNRMHSSDDDESGQNKRKRPQPPKNLKSFVLLAILGVLVCALGVRCWTLRSELSDTLTKLSESQKSVENLTSRLDSADAEIASLTKSLAVTKASLDITTAGLDSKQQEATKLRQEIDRLKKAPATTQKKTEITAGPEVQSPDKSASSGCTSGDSVTAAIIPLVYIASKEALDNGRHNSINSSGRAYVVSAQEADNGRADGEGRIDSHGRSTDSVGSNDRRSNNEN